MKHFLFVMAWISFALGVIGAFVPVMPTTPFLIFAAFLFSKSSPKFHAWLLGLPLAGVGIRDWNERRVIRPKAKIICSVMILASLISLWYFKLLNVYILILISVILLTVGIFVVAQKSA